MAILMVCKKVVESEKMRLFLLALYSPRVGHFSLQSMGLCTPCTHLPPPSNSLQNHQFLWSYQRNKFLSLNLFLLILCVRLYKPIDKDVFGQEIERILNDKVYTIFETCLLQHPAPLEPDLLTLTDQVSHPKYYQRLFKTNPQRREIAQDLYYQSDTLVVKNQTYF